MTTGYTAYITAQTLHHDFGSPGAFEEAVGLLRAAQCSAVVLEAYRAGHETGDGLLGEAAAYFKAQGFEVLGGLMPTHRGAYGKRAVGVETREDFFCYTSELTLQLLENEMRKLARHVDTIVIGDAFETSCRCEHCDAARMNRPWDVFRRDLMCGVARRLRAAAQQTNPKIRVIAKFPQYYDRCHRFGYDTHLFPEIFDAIWAGTETRNPQDEEFGFVEPYQGYFNARYAAAYAPKSFEGAWFDYQNCNDQYFYDQAVTTHLATPPRIVLFSFDRRIFGTTRIRRTTDARAELEALSEGAVEPEGMHVIKPCNSDPGRDHFIYDYLGMIGIPCIPATAIRDDMRSIFIPAQAMDDPHAPQAIRNALDAGAQVIATFGALQRMTKRPDLLEFFGYTPAGVQPHGARVRAFDIDGAVHGHNGPLRIAGDLAPQDAAVLAHAVIDPGFGKEWRAPFVTSRALLSGGRAMVWNIETFGEEAFTLYERLNVPTPSAWFTLPYAMLLALRTWALEPMDYTFDTPPRVACWAFKDRFVFANYTLNRSDVRITGAAWDRESLVSDSPNTALSGRTLLIAPRSYAAVRRIAG